MSDQQFSHLIVAVGARIVERNQPTAAGRAHELLLRPGKVCDSPLVFGVDVSSVVKQILNYRHSVIPSCKVERRGMAALQVPTVHILRAAKLLRNRERERASCNLVPPETRLRVRAQLTCTVSRSPALAASRNL